MNLDLWIIIGFFGQFVFFLRFVVQWVASEKAKKVVIPVMFWYLSIVGSLIILIYSIQRKDVVFCVASILNTILYIRNLYLERRNKNPQITNL